MKNKTNKYFCIRWKKIITCSTLMFMCLILSVPSIMGEELINFHVKDVEIDDPIFSTEKLYFENDNFYEYGVSIAELFPNLCYVLKNIAGEMSVMKPHIM